MLVFAVVTAMSSVANEMNPVFSACASTLSSLVTGSVTINRGRIPPALFQKGIRQ
jgi:hypothetical protein